MYHIHVFQYFHSPLLSSLNLMNSNLMNMHVLSEELYTTWNWQDTLHLTSVVVNNHNYYSIEGNTWIHRLWISTLSLNTSKAYCGNSPVPLHLRGSWEQPPRGVPWVSGLVGHFVQTWLYDPFGVDVPLNCDTTTTIHFTFHLCLDEVIISCLPIVGPESWQCTHM